MSNVIAKGISASLNSGEKTTARENLGVEIGVDVQAYDPDIPTVASSQVEMETGTETALRSMSPLRVKQAIDANAPTIASTAEAQAGTNNTNFLTPLRLRDGVNATGSAPVFAARAWVNFDGTTTTPTIRASGNVSSITKTTTGDYTVNFTTAMPDANYAKNVSISGNGANTAFWSYMLDANASGSRVTPTTTTSRFFYISIGHWGCRP
jgi:hypothetical protein